MPDAEIAESYVTKDNPTIEDWLEYNKNVFNALRRLPTDGPCEFAPFIDVDLQAEKAGVDLEEYYEQVKERVGSLGAITLKLVHSDMDDGWHIVLGRKDQQSHTPSD